MNKSIVVSGAFLILIGILLGAFGAHGLKDLVSEVSLRSFEVGVRYQLYHGLALLVLGLNQDKLSIEMKRVFQLILLGVILFSGSIYILALKELVSIDISFLGPITPIGGVLLISAWAIFILKVVNSKQ